MKEFTHKDEQFKVIITKDEKAKLLKNLANTILMHCKKNNIDEFICIFIYKGIIYMGSDLMEYFYEIAPEIDVIDEGMIVKAYDENNEPLKNLKILYDIQINIRGKHVIILEDFADRVRTFASIRKNIADRHPASLLSIVILGNHENCQELAKEKDVVIGKMIQKEGWIVGSGMDNNNKNRNWTSIVCKKNM